ncbi:MAG: Gfo/Idh/MocA family oxidoreductase [Betaproteobacteria bacterium]|nr:Gfo/Idh/MocA family oxidoreductase [Betaproteobacteria bacterium]
MNTKMNGWGLIGTGKIADDRIFPAINAFAGNKLVAVVSRDQARADAVARKFGAQHAYTSYEDMLRNPDVTVVAIHTPNSLHAGQAIAAARAGKHVFCDKPMATTAADAQRVVKECDQAGVTLGVNFHNRFMPCFIETRRIIDSGEIGEVLVVQLEASPGANPASTRASWRVDPALAGLGTTMSIGVHVYDILRCLLASEEDTGPTQRFRDLWHQGPHHGQRTYPQPVLRRTSGTDRGRQDSKSRVSGRRRPWPVRGGFQPGTARWARFQPVRH